MGKILHHLRCLRCMKQKTRVPRRNYLPSTAVHPCWSNVSIDVSLYVWMICSQGRNKHKVESCQSDFQKSQNFPKKIRNIDANTQKTYVVAFVKGNRVPKSRLENRPIHQDSPAGFWNNQRYQRMLIFAAIFCDVGSGLSFGMYILANFHQQVLENTFSKRFSWIVYIRVVVHLIYLNCCTQHTTSLKCIERTSISRKFVSWNPLQGTLDLHLLFSPGCELTDFRGVNVTRTCVQKSCKSVWSPSTPLFKHVKSAAVGSKRYSYCKRCNLATSNRI